MKDDCKYHIAIIEGILICLSFSRTCPWYPAPGQPPAPKGHLSELVNECLVRRKVVRSGMTLEASRAPSFPLPVRLEPMLALRGSGCGSHAVLSDKSIGDRQ